jgi:chitodextrinase
MSRRARTGAVATVIATLIAIPMIAGAPAASADTQTCTTTGTIDTPDGQYTIQNNEWNSTAPQCVTYTSGTAWSVTTANFSLGTNGAPADYPSIFKGCHWGDCTTGSGLPIQVSNLGSATSSWSTNQVGSGAYDVAYDIWFNSTPTTPGQPDGTEIMIWLNSRGGVQPFGSHVGTSTAAGHNWDVWTGQQTSWKIISFVSNPGVTSVSNLDIKALINDAVSRGSLNPNHWLLDAEAGFEIWQGGQGLGTNSFSFSATAGGGGGTDTQAPTTPASLRVTGTTSTTASLSWAASTDNVGVTGYDVLRNGTRVGTATGTSFTDTGLTPATQFSYTVRARDAAGNLSAPSSAVTATTASGGGTGTGCSATFHIDNQWNGGFTATITVTNSGSAATHGWTVNWAWPGSQSITSMWNATPTVSGQNVSAVNMPYNAAVPSGQSTSFGFQAGGAAATPALTCTAS